MANKFFEILAYEETSLGPLCLRRRQTLSEPKTWVTEITLNHEFLMSSLHTDSEQALATLSLDKLQGDDLSVLIGGLGLGYTAHAALASSRVSQLQVVEFLPQVIQWLEHGMVPLADALKADPRFSVTAGDIYQQLQSDRTTASYDAILIDVDHSPEDQLSGGNAAFYTTDGLTRAAKYLRSGGIIALWSYDQHTPLLSAMRQVLTDVEVRAITYFNRHVHEEFTDWLYLGRRA